MSSASQPTFFFYDLETSGFSPSTARIMQFAGQRTDLELRPLGKPYNYLIELTEDVLPDPDAILVTGITPQQTLAGGIREAQFLATFHTDIATAGTIFIGYNSVRFDDEFMRYLHYRNFYDPYEWQWRDGRSRWDLLDVARMTRALRPDGIQWPFDVKGSPTNRLELLTALNKLDHSQAHDALSDVGASIALARLIYNKQPRLFEFLLKMRGKKEVMKLVTSDQPFLYTSGKYDSKWEKTTAVAVLGELPDQRGALVFDLRYDPRKFTKLTAVELAAAWHRRRDDPGSRLPIKTLRFNRCPAIAPLSVLDQVSAERLDLKPEVIKKNFQRLQQSDLAKRVLETQKLLDEKQQTRLLEDNDQVDTRLYEDFFPKTDQTKMSVVRAAGSEELAELNVRFKDQRLEALLPLYKARNFPSSLGAEEREAWENFKQRKLLGGDSDSRMARYFARIQELQAKPNLTGNEKYLLEELVLYGQAILPNIA